MIETYSDPSAEAVQKYIEAERIASREKYNDLNNEFINKYMKNSDIRYVSCYSPVVIADLTLCDVMRLANADATSEFEYYDIYAEDVEELDTSTVVTEAWATTNTLGYTGSGVKIGQLDSGIPDITHIDQLQSGASHFHINAGDSVSSHASGVACILAGRSTQDYPDGIAPNADVYSTSYRNNGTGAWLENTEWLISNNVNVINISLSFAEVCLPFLNNYNQYNVYSKWLDHISVEHYITVEKSAGNDWSLGITSGGMAYNVITVGNLWDKNTLTLSDDEIWHNTDPSYPNDGSSFYSDSTTHLAYKPDICAPGTGIVMEADPNGMTGTSAATPHITGIVALMFEAKPLLKLYPAAVKAILTATVNPNSNHRYCVGSWNPNSSTGNYAKYGAGLVDAYYAVVTARDYDFRLFYITTDNPERVYSMNVGSVGTTVRVSMAFLINKTTTLSHLNQNHISSDVLQDIDLKVFAPDGTIVASSATSYNNVENVEFTSTQAGTYTIKVYKYTSLINDQEPVECGVSWLES